MPYDSDGPADGSLPRLERNKKAHEAQTQINTQSPMRQAIAALPPPDSIENRPHRALIVARS